MTKKILVFLGILIIISPLGIIIPKYFQSGDAWGEWNVEQVKEKTGYAPKGMKKDAALYSAPVSDYNTGNEKDSLLKQSTSYILSGVLGVGIILMATFGASKLIKRKQSK